MEKTGLINNVISALDRTWDSHNLFESTTEAIVHNGNLAALFLLLKEISGIRDIKMSLGVEQLFLNQELQYYANSPEETNSIKTAITQLQDARSALSVVQNPRVYQEATKTYPAKQKESGLPIDSFRVFIKSHCTRLSNRMASPLSVPEKNLLRQRKENLGMAKEVYMSMQRQALGITIIP